MSTGFMVSFSISLDPTCIRMKTGEESFRTELLHVVSRGSSAEVLPGATYHYRGRCLSGGPSLQNRLPPEFHSAAPALRDAGPAVAKSAPRWPTRGLRWATRTLRRATQEARRATQGL